MLKVFQFHFLTLRLGVFACSLSDKVAEVLQRAKEHLPSEAGARKLAKLQVGYL